MLLKMTGIGKNFSGVRVLDNVDFDLRSGEVHVLAGENGAGKSTLMKILSGAHADYEGAIALDDEVVRFSSPHEAFRCGIAVIHQELSLVDSMSVSDNMHLGREMSVAGCWLRRREQEGRTRGALRRLGLDIDVRQPVGNFSMSVRQLIEIARALAFKARILVMDEPTSSLNEEDVSRLFALMSEIKQACGVIYITHRMDEIYRLADRITVLRDGRHVVTSAAAELSRAELVKRLVGRDLSEQFPARASHSGETVLRVRNFSARRNSESRPLVSDINLDIRAGEIVGFAGLQGSGCSELFHALFDAGRGRTAGDVRIANVPREPRTPRESIRARLALLTNDRKGNGLMMQMDVAANITLASLSRVSPCGWMSRRMERETAVRCRDRFGIKVNSLLQELRHLSGGNQQKVVLAKWLETQPLVLMLDEPTRGVDVGAKHEIYAWMNRWTSEGMAIMLITSELPELLALSDRIVVLHRGRVKAEYERNEATQEKIIHAAMQ